MFMYTTHRYMSTACEDYWQGDLEAALRPHPVLLGSNLTHPSLSGQLC